MTDNVLEDEKLLFQFMEEYTLGKENISIFIKEYSKDIIFKKHNRGILEMLISYSSDSPTKYPDNDFLFLLTLAIEYGASIDQRDVDNRTPLHFAVYADNHLIVDFLTRMGASIDAVDKYGFTPLMRAVDMMKYEIGCMLLERGADPFLSTKNHSALSLMRGGKKDQIWENLRTVLEEKSS